MYVRMGFESYILCSGCIISMKVKFDYDNEVWANASKIPDHTKKIHKVDLKIRKHRFRQFNNLK